MNFFRKEQKSKQLKRLPDGTLKRLNGKTMFIGLGTMKTGTTWLSQYLKGHPEAYHSSLNEMNFFNTLVPNNLQSIGLRRRRLLIRQIILKNGPALKLQKRSRTRLYDFAEIDQFGTDIEKYLEFFAARVGRSHLFGEISPSYAALPAEGIRNIVQSHSDTRLFLIMRDPTARAVSHIQHQMRAQPELDIDSTIEEIVAGNNVYERSNYSATLRSVSEGAPDTKFMTMIYEELFNESSIRSFCDFLGISYKNPRFEHRVNAARTRQLSDEQKLRIRQNLVLIYDEMEDYFGDAKPTTWLW